MNAVTTIFKHTLLDIMKHYKLRLQLLCIVRHGNSFNPLEFNLFLINMKL